MNTNDTNGTDSIDFNEELTRLDEQLNNLDQMNLYCTIDGVLATIEIVHTNGELIDVEVSEELPEALHGQVFDDLVIFLMRAEIAVTYIVEGVHITLDSFANFKV